MVWFVNCVCVHFNFSERVCLKNADGASSSVMKRRQYFRRTVSRAHLFLFDLHMNTVLVLCVLGALYVRCRRYTINMHSMRLQYTCNTYNVSSTSIFT